LDEVRAAAKRIAGVVVRTPLVRFGSEQGKDPVFLKPELLQPTGSFKIRGVYNWAASLTRTELDRGLSTFSAGNTALALGFAARRFGTTARSLLPDYAPAAKVSALHQAGVATELVPFSHMADWLFRAGWRDEPYAFLHPWTEPAMLAGHATIGIEILDEMPDVNTVFIPVGGGALAAGVGSIIKTLRPGCRIVGVQTESCPALAASLAAGKPVWIEPKPTVCDGVAVPFVTDQMFPLLRRVVDSVVTVPEAAVHSTLRRLALEAGLLSEGAGALALAGALAVSPSECGLTACLVTGGNAGPGPATTH
jgi:threonine dehydratase